MPAPASGRTWENKSYKLHREKILSSLCSFASIRASTREKVVEDLGPEVADIDWKTLDPRQYDPRKIIRDALAEEIEETKRVLRGSADDARKLVDSTDAMLKGHTGAKGRPNQGAPTVFDDEAT